MRTGRDFSPGVVTCICFLTLSAATNLRAETDYEFAKALMARSNSDFTTVDIVERLVAQLKSKPDTSRDATLIQAALARFQAQRASAERRAEFLEQASALYKEFQNGPRTHRLYSIGEQDSAATARELLLAKLQLAKDRPELAAKLWQDAAALAQKAVDARRAEVAALYAEFQKWYKEYTVFIARNPNKPLPRELELALSRSFDAWAAADKKLVVALAEQLDCYSDTDPQRKKLAAELIKYCEANSIHEAVVGFPVLSAWYSFMQGKASAAIGDETAAKDAWDLVTDAETDTLSVEQKRQFLNLKKHILRDTASMLMKSKKFALVIEMVERAMRKPDTASIFAEDLGKGIVLDYATAMISQDGAGTAEYEAAAAKLHECIEKEMKLAEHTNWRTTFAQALADLVGKARDQNVSLKLSAAQWYHAANGSFMKGQQLHFKHTEQATTDAAKSKEYFEQAVIEYTAAVDAYRRALSLARSDKTDLQTRLSIEPKAWFETGMCYLKMRQYYEAIIAYSSMRQTFLPTFRDKWLSEKLKAQPRTAARRTEELLKALDPILENSGNNLIFALEQNRALRIKPENSFDQEILKKLADDPKIASRMQDPNFYAAQTALNNASNLFRSIKTAAADEREKLLTETTAKYVEAAEKFKRVEVSAAAYEMSLYQAGAAYARAQEARAIVRPAAKAKDAAELARKALDAFAKFESHVAANPTQDAAKLQQRAAMRSAVQLAQSSLCGQTGDWTAAVKAAESYLAHPNAENKDTAVFNKFRAHVELAAASEAPNGDAHLAGAESSAIEYKNLKPENVAQLDFMFKALSWRYSVAAAQAREKELSPRVVEAYFAKAASTQETRLSLLNSPDLSEHTNLLSLLDKAGDKRKAADFAAKLLEKFDPSNMNATIKDEPKIWQGILKKMRDTIRYSVLEKWDRCKADHKVLIDYMYDTREGTGLPENDARRPEHDKYTQSLDKAAAQIASIRKNFPDCQTLDPRFGENGKSQIGMIADEIDYRRKIQATRQLLSSLALKVSEQLVQSGDDDGARRYRELANQQIKIALASTDDPATQLESGKLDMLNGNFADALRTFRDVRDHADDGSVMYFDASKLISELHARKKEWQLAAEFPEFLVLTHTDDTPRARDRWPDLHEFLKRCYENGAKKPVGSGKQ